MFLLLGSDVFFGGYFSIVDFGWGSFEWDFGVGVLQGYLISLSCIGGCDIVIGLGMLLFICGLLELGVVVLVLVGLVVLVGVCCCCVVDGLLF